MKELKPEEMQNITGGEVVHPTAEQVEGVAKLIEWIKSWFDAFCMNHSFTACAFHGRITVMQYIPQLSKEKPPPRPPVGAPDPQEPAVP